jgi:divalent metal cation (Fe/Co/Zn/Cd) transporter
MINQAEVHVEVDGNKPLKDIELLSAEIQNAVRSKIPTMERISIIPHSFSEKPETRMARLFRNRNRNKANSKKLT